ncbi:MAG: D-ribose pyranase [Endozoicomonas sp.]
MKKTRLLNPQLSQVIASLGHGQGLTICDCGLPIGQDTERVDLALTHGVPGFLETLDVVLSETVVEQVIIAEEFAKVSPEAHEAFVARIRQLEAEQGKPVEVVEVSHESFKAESDLSQAVVRTGECTPYANVILKSGVAF